MAIIEYRPWPPPLGGFATPADPWPFSVGVDPVDLRSHVGKHILLVAEPFDVSSSVSLGPYGPLGDPIYPAGGNWGWRGRRTTIYPAATLARSTRNDDTPAATFVSGRLQPFNFGEQLFSGVDPGDPASAPLGVIELVDPEDSLSWLLDYGWDGAAITLKRGRADQNFADWETVGRYTSAGLVQDADVKWIRLRDGGWALQGLIHDEYYGGTGGLDGDSAAAGIWKPYTVGNCYNVEPQLISAQYQVFQWSIGPSTSLMELRHGGIEIDIAADYPTWDALIAATIPSGEAATCLAQSLVLPNLDLEFGIRVDVSGDAVNAYGRGTPLTRAAIARRIATGRGASRLNDATQIDSVSFNAVEARHTATLGYHWNTPTTKADALTEIMSGILGWWRMKSDGTLAIGYIDDPARGSSMTLAYKDFGMGKPEIVDWTPPRAGTYLGWRRNYGPQRREDLAPGVDDTTASLLAKDSRWSQALYPHVQPMYPTATYARRNGGFWQQSDCDLECARQQGVMGVERRRWRWPMLIDPHADLVARGITVLDANVAELGAAKPLIVVGSDTAGDDTVTMDFWG